MMLPQFEQQNLYNSFNFMLGSEGIKVGGDRDPVGATLDGQAQSGALQQGPGALLLAHPQPLRHGIKVGHGLQSMQFCTLCNVRMWCTSREGPAGLASCVQHATT